MTTDAQPRASPGLESLSTLSTASIVPSGGSSLQATARRAAMAYERRSPEQADVLLIGGESFEPTNFERTNWAYHEVADGVPIPEHCRSVTRDELMAALRSDPLYVHYGNSITPAGFVCSDGLLRFEDVPEASVGALSFPWNQAETAPVATLLDTATVVCLHETPMQPETADAFAKYLVLGYPPALATRFVGLGDATRFIGDGTLSLTDHPNGALPVVFDIEQTGDDGYRASFSCQIARPDELGSLVIPTPFEDARHSLTSASTPINTSLAVADLVDIAEGDQLLQFHCEPPDQVPQESIIHESRPGWLDGGSDGSKSQGSSEPQSRR